MGIGISLGGGQKKEKSKTERDQRLTGTTTGHQTGETAGWGQSASAYWTPEQQLMGGQLSRYLGGSLGNLTADQRAGQDALRRAATGQGYQDIIDPAASNAMYQAVEKQTLEDILPKSTRALANEANLSGMLRSGPALQMQLDNRDQIVNQLSSTLSGLKYQDELQRRGILQEREGRQMGAGQALLTDPNQQNIQNMLSMLGIRGQASETSQTRGTTEQDSVEEIVRKLYETMKSKGKGSSMSAGLNLGL